MKGITLYINEDEMSATLTLVTQTNCDTPNIEEVINYIRGQGVVFGLSRKRIFNILQQSEVAETGTEFCVTVAKGLPPRNGKDSCIKPLLRNVFERYLMSHDKHSNSDNWHSLAAINGVNPNYTVAKRIPPTAGRLGKTITGKTIASIPGKLIDINLGINTKISATDKNIIVASISGIAKFENGVMSIEEAYIVTGVNVRTGNIKFEGAVIVNGDVTENMQIIAKGDVVINGYVESAYIHSQGDIIITEGATGKMHDEDCQLIANGNIFVQHAQGLDITAGKDVNIAIQLAYSRVKTLGNVTIGSRNNPMGNLFACTIHCSKTVQAGSIGAISGSELLMDFSEGYESICTRLDSIIDLHKLLTTTNAKHENKLTELHDYQLPECFKNKFLALNNELEAERLLLLWLKDMQTELQESKQEYENNVQVFANKELLPSVSVKLNKNVWRSEREYQQCKLRLNSGNWQNISLV